MTGCRSVDMKGSRYKFPYKDMFHVYVQTVSEYDQEMS